MILVPTETGGRPAIRAFGDGGFKLDGYQHQGSVLLFPDGAWAWDVTPDAPLDVHSFEPVIARASEIDFLLVGMGRAHPSLSAELRRALRNARLPVETMATPAAARTYNVLLGDGRAFAAALLAVD